MTLFFLEVVQCFRFVLQHLTVLRVNSCIRTINNFYIFKREKRQKKFLLWTLSNTLQNRISFCSIANMLLEFTNFSKEQIFSIKLSQRELKIYLFFSNLLVLLVNTENPTWIFTRPCVSGAVLQTPSSLIDQVSDP